MVTSAVEIEVLSDAEAAALDAAEQVIERGIKTFVTVGDALLRIRDGRLYRTTYATFEDYCRQRWDLGRNYVNKVITATEITAAIGAELGTAVPTPANERQVRELAPLRDDAQVLASTWKDAVDRAGGSQPSYAEVRDAVREMNANSQRVETSISPPPRPAPRRQPLPDQLRSAVYELRKAAERVERLTEDGRFPTYREDFVIRHRSDLEHIGAILGVVAVMTRQVKQR